MPSYTVKLPSGESYTVSGENDEEVMAHVKSLSEGGTASAPTGATAPQKQYTNDAWERAVPKGNNDTIWDQPIPGQAADAGRRPSSADARANAKDAALSAIPTIAAGAAALATGPAAPLAATAIAALVGGFTGKGIEMGLRTGTGVGAETVPSSTAGRLVAAGSEGLKQASYELGAGVAMGAAQKAAEVAMSSSASSKLGQMITMHGKEASASASKIAALEAKAAEAEMLAKEELFRAGHIESAHAGAAKALEDTGAGVPAAGMTDMAVEGTVKPLAHELKNDVIRNMGAEYVGLGKAAASRAPDVPVDTRPMFKKAVSAINEIQAMKGTGGMFTELNPTLAELRARFEMHGKGKAAVIEPPPPVTTTAGYLATPERRISEALDALDKNETLGGLLVMRGGLAQEIAQARMAGPKSFRLLSVLEPLADDTDKLIRATMGKVGWKEGPAALDAANKAWGAGKDYLAHQVFAVASANPGRLHELVTSGSGYAPVVKKVLTDMGVEKQMWPEVRRRWIESNFIKGESFDAGAFMQSARQNRSVINELFDTPEAMDQYRRLHLAAARIEALQGGALKGVADYAKAQKFQATVDDIGNQILALEAKAADRTAKAEAAIKRESGMNLRSAIPWGRGMAGGAAGFAVGHSPEAAVMGAIAGAATKPAEAAFVRHFVEMANDPVRVGMFNRALDVWGQQGAQNAERAAQLLRSAVISKKLTRAGMELVAAHRAEQQAQ